MNQTTPEDDAARIAVTALRDWESDVDAVQRARLAAARRRALSPALVPARYWQGAALAATLLLSVGVGFWPHSQPGIDPIVLQAVLEQSLPGADARAAELMLDDDLDFYLWLDNSAEHR